MKNIISRIIGVGLYGMIVGGWGGGGGGSGGSGDGDDTELAAIPYLLVIESGSGGIYLAENEAAVVGIQGYVMTASTSADDDYLSITVEGDPTVEDGFAELRVTDDGLVSYTEISAEYQEEGLTISYPARSGISDDGDSIVMTSTWNPGVDDEYTILRVTGESERTIRAVDFLVSRGELYGEFQDDGLMIYYEADAEFSLEMITRSELISHGGA